MREETEVLTTRNGVAGDTLPSEPTAHGAREVVETSLASTVGVGFMAWDHDSFNRTNLMIVNEHLVTSDQGKEIAHIDDTSRVEIRFTLFSTFIGGTSQERQTFLGKSEHSVKVQRQDFGPSLILITPPSKIQSPSRKLGVWDVRDKCRTCLPKRLQRC